MAQPLTDALAVSAVKRIFQYLPAAYKDGDDSRAREEMSAAALEAGICINNSSVTIVHGMSRPIGALFHVPHGLSNAMLLEKCMAFAADGAADRFAKLARAIGKADANDSDLEAARKFAEAVEKLAEWNKTMKLDTVGIREFEAAYHNKTYPGLGVVKKYSIMHHLELMSKYLDGVAK